MMKTAHRKGTEKQNKCLSNVMFADFTKKIISFFVQNLPENFHVILIQSILVSFAYCT